MYENLYTEAGNGKNDEEGKGLTSKAKGLTGKAVTNESVVSVEKLWCSKVSPAEGGNGTPAPKRNCIPFGRSKFKIS